MNTQPPAGAFAGVEGMIDYWPCGHPGEFTPMHGVSYTSAPTCVPSPPEIDLDDLNTTKRISLGIHENGYAGTEGCSLH